jgi:hypothetical protein
MAWNTTRYKAAIDELAAAIIDIPLNELPAFHRDIDAAIKRRDIAVHQALNADANRQFLESILDLQEIDDRRHPRMVWKTKGKAEWLRKCRELDAIGALGPEDE